MTEPTDEPSVETTMGFEHVATAVDKAIEKLDEDRAALRSKMRWWRRAVVVLGILCALSTWSGLTAHTAVDKLRRQRTESRIAQCANDNDTAEKINGVGDAVGQILAIATPADPNRPSDQQARVDDFVRRADAALDKAKVSARDCSPKGIDRFYTATTTTTR